MARKRLKSATDQRPFTIIYNDFLESELLDTYYQKLVFIYLKKFADSNNQCFPSHKTLARLTKISVNKIKSTLTELEEKGVIEKTNRKNENGGKTSNLYTLYDYGGIWGVNSTEKDKNNVAEEVEEAKLIALLRQRGYIVTKEKELETPHTDQSNDDSSTKKNLINFNKNDTIFEEKSQEKFLTLDDVRKKFDYNILIEEHSLYRQNIESVMSVLFNTLSSKAKFIRVCSENKLAGEVKKQLLKLDSNDIMNVIRRFNEQSHEIKKGDSYLLTMLYKAKEQNDLKLTNEVQNDMTN